MSKKRFHKSDSMLYTFTFIYYPPNFDDINFTRETVQVHASPGVTWRDIVKEINDFATHINVFLLGGPVLETCMVDYPDFVVALTFQGAHRIIKGMVEGESRIPTNALAGAHLYLKKVDDFAKEMVAYRDLKLAESKLPQNKGNLHIGEFWPKD